MTDLIIGARVCLSMYVSINYHLGEVEGPDRHGLYPGSPVIVSIFFERSAVCGELASHVLRRSTEYTVYTE
jgi:hypothetical protein